MRTLRVDDQPGEDTRYQVRAVLQFMSESFNALENETEPHLIGAMRGAACILGLCADALREPEEPDIHEGQERGADGE